MKRTAHLVALAILAALVVGCEPETTGQGDPAPVRWEAPTPPTPAKGKARGRVKQKPGPDYKPSLPPARKHGL